ncbi:MAG: ribosomal protein S17 [Candidatus Berkelbacteria bacterium]|nr:ribosomal protein S17 [Candidatus Berkelbacteria bacterium]MCR4307602.1 ribosomal protein S17 [Candidatus Berkelbacteria bacterium]
MQKYLTGVVVTNTAKDTAVVEVVTWKTHRIFKKRYKRTGRYLVHNPGNLIEVGAKVEIIPTRPISKRKFWRIQPLSEKIATKKVSTRKPTKLATKKGSK